MKPAMTIAKRGWVRITPYRSQIMIAVTLGLTALGFFALHRLLAEMHFREFREAAHHIPPDRILLALLLTTVSYLALTLYDYFALRVIGRPLPWRTAALASFCSYTLSHNLGLSLLTGGSARFRIYSVAGLAPGDIARVIASASLSFWSGVFVMAGLALAAHPVDLSLWGLILGAGTQRIIGMAILLIAAIAFLLLGSSGRGVKLAGWRLMLPSRSFALAQIAVACVDLAVASAALYVLVPGADPSLYPAFFLGYAVAIIVALFSHVPGGIGVFEAVMIATLPTVDQPGLLAALLAYRVIYYLLPLLVAAVLIAVTEGRAWHRPFRQFFAGTQSLVSSIAPMMLAVLVSGGGIVLLISGSLPAVQLRMHVLDDILPQPFIEVSHVAGSITGMALIILAAGLYRRLDGAFWMTRLLLLAGALFSLLKGIDYEEAFVLLVIAGLLQWTAPAFYRKTRFTAEILTPAWLLALGIAASLSLAIGLFAYKHVAYDNALWWQFGAPHGGAARFLRAELAVGMILIGALLWRLLEPASMRSMALMTSGTAPETALALADRTDAYLACTGDKLFLTSATGRAFIMYQVQGRSWIMMGDPVGDRSEWPDLVWRLREMADAAQGRLMLYQLSLDALPLAVDMGLAIVKYGEEAQVLLDRFSLEGPSAKSLRHAARRAAREGATFEIMPAAEVPAMLDEMGAISQQWLSAKHQTEKAFSVGRFDRAYLRQFDCAVVRWNGHLVAFANIWATHSRSELSIDLMRHAETLPYGTMDFLFTELMSWGKAQGFARFSLGLAPLSGIEARRLAPLWAKAGAFLYRHGESFYGFEGLRAYKDKFTPEWEPRFIAGPQGLSMARALIDLQTLIGGGRGSVARVRPSESVRLVG
jgi:phosphatidylglycerol lysyltransferase